MAPLSTRTGRSRSDGDGAESDRGRSAQDQRDAGVSGRIVAQIRLLLVQRW
jgi:hypothetical protein